MVVVVVVVVASVVWLSPGSVIVVAIAVVEAVGSAHSTDVEFVQALAIVTFKCTKFRK